MVAFDAKWSDVGSWKALYEIGKHDENGNVLKGGKVITEGVKNSYIHADHHMVVAIGVDDLVIVDTADATLVAAKDKAVDVKVIVNHLERENHEEHSVHRKVFRPWGWYDSVDFGERFHVKRILVKPGGSLSLQKHNFRAEHWIVVSGSAKVINNEKEFILRTNESTYIPIGHKHRLENIEESPLEIIEVQSGSYFGEDDIERFDDYYGRHSELSSEDNTE